MSFPKGLTCFLEMDLCYVILNISCCLLLCHNSKIPIKNENILNLKKKAPCICIGKHMVQADIASVPWKHLFSTKYI